MGVDVWLTYWSEQVVANEQEAFDRRGFYWGIYAALGLSLGLFTIVRSFGFAFFSAKASRTLHKDMFVNIIRAPMQFFDTTPIGRILNRFSKDTDAVDILLPPVMENELSMLLNVVGVYVLICVYLPWFIIAVIPIFAAYLIVQFYYQRSSRELQRIESVQRSPIFAHFSESLIGVR